MSDDVHAATLCGDLSGLRDVTTHDNKVALDTIHPGDAREESPTLEFHSLEEPQTGFVMAENAAHQRGKLQTGTMRDGFFQKRLPDSAASEFLAHVNTDFRGGTVGAASNERVKTQPAGELSIDLSHPERMGFR